MGLFGKIKNILFEPDEEEIIDDIPVYTKEEVKEVPKKEEVIVTPKMPEEPPVKQTNTTHTNTIKRDIDIDYEAKNVLGEVPGAIEAIHKAAEEQAYAKPRVEEKPSPFQAFDEKEFERVNSRLAKNEHKMENKSKEIDIPVKAATTNTINNRKTNSLFSSTTANRDIKVEHTINSSVTTGKKPFTPSPVISPVYGILDKNYRKDDIVDRQGGMKREKVVKPIVKEEEPVETLEIDIDLVRKKAYGTLEDIEKEMEEVNITTDIPKVNEVSEVNDEDEIVLENVTPDIIEDTGEDEIHEAETTGIMDDDDDIMNHIDEDLTLGDLINLQNNSNNDNNISVEDELEQEFEPEKEPNLEVKEQVDDKEDDVLEDMPRPRLLDDMEKTSTLQILDDIEKELNSIKPINKDVDIYNDDDVKEKIEKSETLENDLFNLIDSMYEQGEEEEDD